MDSRPCSHCGAETHRRKNESRQNWAKRRYCSHQCADEARSAGATPYRVGQLRLWFTSLRLASA